MYEPGESLNQFRDPMLYNFHFLNLPEFKGQPGESIEAFLKAFGRATTTMGPEKKCLALKRALAGDAAIFAKNYLKADLAANKWKEVKEALRNRFSPTDRELMNRSELRNMVFNKETSTLLGYVDRYANLYRKVHPKAEDLELIGDIGLNLGAELVRKLNQISPGWQMTCTFESFRALINRLEKDILAYETTKGASPAEIMNVVNKTVMAAMEEQSKDIKSWLEAAARKPEEAVERVLAAVEHSGPSRNRRRFFKRKEREWDDKRPVGSQKPKSATESTDQSGQEATRLQELMKLYEESFGKLNGVCFTCNGHHFKRHCPLENIESLKA